MIKRAEIKLRIVTALLMGLAVTVIALNTARQVARTMEYSPQRAVREGFWRLDDTIIRYQKQRHSLPRSLGEIAPFAEYGWPQVSEIQGHVLPICLREDGVLLDPWLHPYVYTVKGTHYLITSYGRDGKPGRVGYDCDRTNLSTDPPEATPTFPQLVSDSQARRMVVCSEITGALVFLLTLFIVRPRNFSGPQIRWLLGKLLLTFLAATFIATMMVAVEAPSGH